MGQYEEIEIGEGSFGKIYNFRNYRHIVAIKTIFFHECGGVPSSVIREIALLKDMDHSNIVLSTDNKVSLVFEHVEKDLNAFLQINHSINQDPEVIKVGNMSHSAPQVLLGSTQYSSPSDIWSFGCVFAIIVMRNYLFVRRGLPKDLLNQISRVIGTPDEQMWPGVTTLFPVVNKLQKFHPQNLAVQGLEPAGIDLLSLPENAAVESKRQNNS